MYIVTIAVLGFLIGIIARALILGRDSWGFFAASVLGIGGAFIGLGVGRLFGFFSYGDLAGFVGAALGSLLVMWIFRGFRTKQVTGH